MDTLLSFIFTVVFIVFASAAYFAPSIVAFGRKHKNAPAILMLNFLTGWTGVGWVGAFVWAFTSD